MQAIRTHYIPATNTKPSRVKATCERGSITISWDSSGDTIDPHIKASGMLCAKFAKEDFEQYGWKIASNPWMRDRVCGCLPDGSYAHVFVD